MESERNQLQVEEEKLRMMLLEGRLYLNKI